MATEDRIAGLETKVDDLVGRVGRVEHKVDDLSGRVSRIEGVLDQLSRRAAIITQTIAIVGLIATVLLTG